MLTKKQQLEIDCDVLQAAVGVLRADETRSQFSDKFLEEIVRSLNMVRRRRVLVDGTPEQVRTMRRAAAINAASN